MRSVKIIGLLVLMLCSSLAPGQNLFNGSIISIGSNSVLFVKDTIINEGTIVNNGDMQVGGSWINHSAYDAGVGQITFNSDQPQIINHNDQSFSRLTLNGGGEKLFLADITIENELNLTDGILVARGDSRIVVSESALVTGGSETSYVRGPVYHRGAGNKVFPVGNGSLYLPVEILNIGGTSPEIGVTAVELEAQTLAVSPSLTAVSADRYWEIDVVSGSLNSAQVVLPVKHESIVTTSEEVVVAHAASLEESFASLGRGKFEGNEMNGRVTSEKVVHEGLVAVGTASAREGIFVYNAVSPNGDDQNEFLIIGNIEHYPENKFSLFNRWGDKVFEIDNYDNQDRVFRGKGNVNGDKDLGNGTYFYIIKTADGPEKNGFLVLKN